jgi:ubiquinone/menaquinone biosynthesis C-methylase UbiE
LKESLSEDVRDQRKWLLSLCSMPSTGTVVDLGCGKGDDLLLLAETHLDSDLRFIGVDASQSSLATAIERSHADRRVQFLHRRLAATLPFTDATVDVLYSNNFLECVAERPTFALECARILRPGGLLVVGHWDFDSQTFDGPDKVLVRRLVHAYADWQQAWMDHADGWMGRRLWGVFHPTKHFAGTIHARVLINTSYAAPWYGHARVQDFRALVEKGIVSADDYARFVNDVERLDREGSYFYSITGYAYVARKLDAASTP